MQVTDCREIAVHAVRRTAFAGAVVMAFGSSAFAQAIDLTKPYGTEVGCQNQTGQKVESEDMLLVTNDAIVTSTSTCTFFQKLTAPDGTLVVTSLCTIADEEGRSINQFSIARGKKDPAKLAIFDEYGAAFDEVAPCP